jgi:hypothetical protein
LYLQCPSDQDAGNAAKCFAFASTLASANDATHCLDFYFSTLHSESTSLPPPEPPEYPQTWVTNGMLTAGCDKLKSFSNDAGVVSPGGLDYHQSPAGCALLDGGAGADIDATDAEAAVDTAGTDIDATDAEGALDAAVADDGPATNIALDEASGGHDAEDAQPSAARLGGANGGGCAAASMTNRQGLSWPIVLGALLAASGLRRRRGLSCS